MIAVFNFYSNISKPILLKSMIIIKSEQQYY